MKKYLSYVILILFGASIAGSATYLNGDAIRNPARTQIWTLPATGGTLVKSTDNIATATALAANGANCSANSFPLGVDASGAVESCSTSISGNAATATALAANPADCGAGTYAQSIDASGVLTCAKAVGTFAPSGLRIATTSGAAQSVTSGSWTLYSNANYATNKTYIGSAVQGASANDASFKIASLPAGGYIVWAVGASYAYTGGTATVCDFSIYDGTNLRGIANATANVLSQVDSNSLHAYFTYATTQTNIVFGIYGIRSSGNGDCYLDASSGAHALEFMIIQIYAL